MKGFSLFRPEAVRGQQQAWLGSIQLIRPVSFAVLTTLVLATVALLALVLVEGRYTRKAHVAGFLVPDKGVLRLLPQQSGTVLELETDLFDNPRSVLSRNAATGAWWDPVTKAVNYMDEVTVIGRPIMTYRSKR